MYLYTHYLETNAPNATTVPGFEFEVATAGDSNPGILGLGLSSTLLQKLFVTGLTAGRTFSLYVGSGMDRAAGMINGSLTLGGYDSGRFSGEVHNYTVNPNNAEPLSVHVTDIVLNDPNGTVQQVSLFDTKRFPGTPTGDLSFDAMLTTDQYPMTLPYAITRNFVTALAAVNSTESDGSLQVTNPFTGTMSIKLSDGFTVVLPPEVVSNISGLSPVQARSSDSIGPNYLGLSFLSQVYLMVDYDDYTFHLAQPIIDQISVMPQIFCPKTVPLAYIPPQQNPFASTGLIGAVVGGAVGGSMLIAVVIVAIIALRRRKVEKWRREEELSLYEPKTPGIPLTPGLPKTPAYSVKEFKEFKFEAPPAKEKAKKKWFGGGKK